MTPLTASLIASGIQSGLIVLLAADRWVHRITGATPLEARISALELTIREGNARSSKRASELTVYLEARRTEVGTLREEVATIKGILGRGIAGV